MIRRLKIAALPLSVALASACLAIPTGRAQDMCGTRGTRADLWANSYAQVYTWHGDYYHISYGAPVALVVPPTAGMQSDYHWGVAGYRTTPIYHQFRRGYPGIIGGRPPAVFRGTPRWPSDTDQFGVYYVRGPW